MAVARTVHEQRTQTGTWRRGVRQARSVGAQPLSAMATGHHASRRRQGVTVTEVLLNYDRGIVGQETGYWCGPASAQVVLNGMGIRMAERDLAREIGTTTRGTDYVGLIERVLDRHAERGNYTSVYLERDPISALEKERLWGHLVQSINAGYGVVMNWVAPPSNKPRGARGSVSPRYSGGTTYHYVSAMGYSDEGGRFVWIADSGFQPQGYWITFDQCATLIPPKGYSYANTSQAPQDIPTPTQTPPVALLSKVMGDVLPLDKYATYLPYFSELLRNTNSINNNRIANVAAQLRHESVGLKYFRELWGPTADQANYDNMMGNRPGEGRKFLGRGPLQVTGRDNYTALSKWAHAKGHVPQADYFLVKPEALELPEFGFLGAAWYIDKVNPRFNELADSGDIERTSKLINMPAWVDRTDKRANGIGPRTQYFNQARGMNLMPLLDQSGDLTMADAHSLTMLFAGQDPNGKPLLGPDGADFRRVDFGRQWTGPGDDPAGPHTTRSTFDEVTLLAKLLGQRYTNQHGQSLDVFDLLVSLYQSVGEPKVEGPQAKS